MNKVIVSSLSIAILAAVTAAATFSFADEQGIEYPEGYRDWTHIKSMVIEEGHSLYGTFGGIHHLYANDKALRGYESGKFPKGSIIAFDLLEARRSDNAVVEGARKVLGVMVKDNKRFAETGGWGFEGFAGGEPSQPVVGDDAVTACYTCHISQRERDYVFSAWRD